MYNNGDRHDKGGRDGWVEGSEEVVQLKIDDGGKKLRYSYLNHGDEDTREYRETRTRKTIVNMIHINDDLDR